MANGTNWNPVTPGASITFGGWVKRVGGTGVLDWGCEVVDANHNLAAWCGGGGGPGDGSGGTNWQLYTVQVTVPSNGAYVRFFAEIHGWGDTDTSLTSGYFDSAFIDAAPIWQQSFTYDAFGNINKTGNSSFNAAYSSSTNHMTQIGSSTPTYDSDGNVTNDFLHTYSWNGYGRPTTIDGVGITYDALGRMVEQSRAGVYTQMLYSPTGFLMSLMNGQTYRDSFVPMPAGSATVWSASPSVVYYRHTDWLGSSRLATTSTGTVYSDTAYAPFGEQYANSGTSDLSFTGMDQDTSSNLYDFPAREYGIQGRWPSPDPAGLDAVDPNNPQSWNRYAYVQNSPLNLIDPLGLDTVPCGDGFCTTVTDPIGSGGSGFGGGVGGGGGGGDGGFPLNCQFSPACLAGWRANINKEKRKPQAQSNVCTQRGLGVGVSLGGNADLGVGKAGAAGTGSAGVGLFGSSGNGLSGGAYATGGAAAYAGTHSAGVPAQNGTSVFGAFAGAGASVFVTNAGSVQQMSGNFSTLNFNVGYSFAQLQISWASGNGVWMLSFSGPKMGVGYGFSVTTLNTNTVTTKGGC